MSRKNNSYSYELRIQSVQGYLNGEEGMSKLPQCMD